MASILPRHLLDVVRDFINSFEGMGGWEVDEKLKYMTDVLEYKIQTDGYSCGFYYMCSLGEFADISELPNATYRTERSTLVKVYATYA